MLLLFYYYIVKIINLSDITNVISRESLTYALIGRVFLILFYSAFLLKLEIIVFKSCKT